MQNNLLCCAVLCRTIPVAVCCPLTPGTGYQALLFAPTELLATQHYKTLEKLAEELPMGVRPRIGILTGSLTAAAKRDFKQEIAAGRLNIIISTQAALYVDAWDKLALVVIDEQHK
jgi:ATP-dependent DNA helicase RecG